MQQPSYFPRRAGDHIDTDNILAKELRYAGIPTIWDTYNAEPHHVRRSRHVVRQGSGDVKTSTYGELYGWEFTRFPRYWEAKGPGIDVETAELLHKRYGHHVRVGGDGTGPSPRAHYKGLACGYYHVDTFEGLKALADTIKLVVEGPKPFKIFGIKFPILGDFHQWLTLM